jgi:predicted nucleotidyltransferase
MSSAVERSKKPDDARPVIQEMVRRIASRFHPERIILFGSHARGMSGPDSDVDLLVVMRVKGSRRKKATEIDVALKAAPLPKDIIVVTPEDVARQRDLVGTIIRPALREGKVLYERTE